MAEEFTWCVRTETTGTGTFDTRSAKFGDGYEQAAAEGINNERQQWPVSLVGKESKIEPALAFLRARRGATSFLWTPPLGAQGLYRCNTYSLTPHGNGVFTLNATFEQTFQP